MAKKFYEDLFVWAANVYRDYYFAKEQKDENKIYVDDLYYVTFEKRSPIKLVVFDVETERLAGRGEDSPDNLPFTIACACIIDNLEEFLKIAHQNENLSIDKMYELVEEKRYMIYNTNITDTTKKKIR